MIGVNTVMIGVNIGLISLLIRYSNLSCNRNISCRLKHINPFIPAAGKKMESQLLIEVIYDGFKILKI